MGGDAYLFLACSCFRQWNGSFSSPIWHGWVRMVRTRRLRSLLPAAQCFDPEFAGLFKSHAALVSGVRGGDSQFGISLRVAVGALAATRGCYRNSGWQVDRTAFLAPAFIPKQS